MLELEYVFSLCSFVMEMLVHVSFMLVLLMRESNPRVRFLYARIEIKVYFNVFLIEFGYLTHTNYSEWN